MDMRSRYRVDKWARNVKGDHKGDHEGWGYIPWLDSHGHQDQGSHGQVIPQRKWSQAVWAQGIRGTSRGLSHIDCGLSFA